jgi:hypothetical protein
LKTLFPETLETRPKLKFPQNFQGAVYNITTAPQPQFFSSFSSKKLQGLDGIFNYVRDKFAASPKTSMLRPNMKPVQKVNLEQTGGGYASVPSRPKEVLNFSFKLRKETMYLN